MHIAQCGRAESYNEETQKISRQWKLGRRGHVQLSRVSALAEYRLSLDHCETSRLTGSGTAANMQVLLTSVSQMIN